MASRFMSGGLPGGRNTLDVPVAALAGLSVAFATFAAPADLLAELVGSSGVAAFIPSAEPPLGMNARIAIGGGGAVLMFAVAFLLLRWLDRFGSRQSERETEAESAFDTPRLRRRDLHPDAPPRPPLAARELGEPERDHAPAPEAELQPEAPATPSWRSEMAEPEVAEPEAEEPSEPEPEAQAPPVRPPAYSMAELLERLEQGLSRRRAEATAQAAPTPPPLREAGPAPQPFPEPADDRLQSAIDSLQRLAARHD
jgi:hypothetical protein